MDMEHFEWLSSLASLALQQNEIRRAKHLLVFEYWLTTTELPEEAAFSTALLLGAFTKMALVINLNALIAEMIGDIGKRINSTSSQII